MNDIFCPWEHSEYLFLSSNVPDLIHYSHGLAVFSALTISILVFISQPKNRTSQLFLLFSSLFSLWVTLDVILWATNDPSLVMFSWALQVLIEPVTYVTAFYLFYTYIFKKWPSFSYNLLFFSILLPLIVFLPTTLNLQGLLLETCESIEGPIAKYYSYFANTIPLLFIIFIGIFTIPKLDNKKERLNAIFFSIGLITFLFSFTFGNIISSFSDDWVISQYGLFAMPVFALLIAYSIVRFNAFNIKVVGSQVLVFVLFGLVGSLSLIVKSDTSRFVAATTLIFTTTTGYFLVRGVKREVLQREQIEKLAKGLQKANERLQFLDKQKSEFVSIASHQLRSPLTAIRGYTSMALEGSFGVIPDKAREAMERISESAKFMSLSINDFLDVSRIESGNMKYDYTDVNFKEQAEHIVEDLKNDALKKGLLLMFRSDMNGSGIVRADAGKTQQILHNLINNALKYTLKGSVVVYTYDDLQNKKMFVEIIDTGLGMSAETIDKLFAKFSRAKIASSANIMGTGLGLFVAREMCRAMGGDISCSSAGEGKGSIFKIELPIA